MPIDFPSTPDTNDEYFYGGKWYRYTGSYWANLIRNSNTATGFLVAVLLDDYREVLVTAGTNAVKNMNSVEITYI
jgi:hypothetical protein